MDWLTVEEVIDIHQKLIQQSGGATGIRDLGALQSAVAQPQASFAGQLLYPDVVQQASALGFSLINNHPFVDGNKRIGHAAMNVFLAMHGFDIDAGVDEQEQTILAVAAGQYTREQLTNWLEQHIIPWGIPEP